MLAFPNLPVLIGGLLVGQPAGIIEAVAERLRDQQDGIAAVIGPRTGGVQRRGETARLPRLAPRREVIALDVGEELIGEALAEVGFGILGHGAICVRVRKVTFAAAGRDGLSAL